MILPIRNIRSAYHTKIEDIYRLDIYNNIYKKNLDIFLSHDWPIDIHKFGNEQ